jgi:hypothetical protein
VLPRITGNNDTINGTSRIAPKVFNGATITENKSIDVGLTSPERRIWMRVKSVI